MILVIGGLASGKREYVKKEYGFADCDMADGILNESPVIYNLQDLVRKNPNIDSLLEPLLKKSIIICNEVGCGVVPISKEERMVRETTGRLCVLLAQHAEQVIRVQCGIPVIIKG